MHFVTLVLKKLVKTVSWASALGFGRSREGEPCCRGSLSPARATTPAPQPRTSLQTERRASAFAVIHHLHRRHDLATRYQGPGEVWSRAGWKSSYHVTVTRNRLPRGRRGAQMSSGPLPLASWPQDGRRHSGCRITSNQPPWRGQGVPGQRVPRGARRGWRERSQAETGRVPRPRARVGCERCGAFGSSFPASASDCSWKQAAYKL